MKIEDVKQWNCNGERAVAVNPYLIDFSGIHIDDIRYTNWSEYEQWLRCTANQPVTSLNGVFGKDEVEIIWQYWAVNKWVTMLSKDVFKDFEGWSKRLNTGPFPVDTRRRLILALGVSKMENTGIAEPKEGKQEVKPDYEYLKSLPFDDKYFSNETWYPDKADISRNLIW